MIELNHIYKKYGDKEVLKNINITLKDTGLVSILGKSGSGKSTLLNLIGLLDKPTSGDIFVDGVRLSKLKEKDIDYYHFKYVGFLFQQYNLFNNLTVKDNILIVNNSEDINNLLKNLNILNLKNSYVKNLSGGERQRVALVRSIINKPKILLCDEPTGALDSKMSKTIMEMLKKLSKDMLVIVVTHDEELANIYSDEIIRIQDGYVKKSVTKYKIRNKYKKGKVKINLLKLLKIVINNLLSKKKRNILVILALFIGFFTLTLVLGISDGFVKSMEYENKNSMSKFPIYISKTSSNISNDLNNLFLKNEKNDKIYTYDYNHVNKYDFGYINDLNKINDNLSYKIFSYNINDLVINVSMLNNVYENFFILNGRHIQHENEVFLLINDDFTIDANILDTIGLGASEYSFSSLIGYKYIIDDVFYTIVGVGKVMDNADNIFASGLYYNIKMNQVPDLISLYPKDYENKEKVINHLNNYKDIYYTDYADSITDISKTLVNSIKIVLVVFSMLSLLVSIIMVGILCYVSILERVKDIGILKSLGVSNKRIKFIFYLENIIICLSSCYLSITSLNILKYFINNLLFKIIGIQNVFYISNSIKLKIIILSIIIGIISTYLPIKSVKKYTIIDTINNV